MIGLQTLRAEIRPTLQLAIPLVLAELGWMSMAIVDTMMVGRLPNSATAMGAVSLGSNIFIVLALFGGGLLMGLDTLVSQAFGAGRREDCHRSLLNSIYLSIALTPFLSAPVWLLPSLLAGMHVDPGVLALAIPYTKALAVGLLPLLLYFAVRRCLQAMNMVRPVAFALVSANVINALGNWILVYGKWGVPSMGAVGSGWSTAIARLYMASVLVGYLLWYDRKHRTELLRTPVDIDLPRIRRLITLGLPAAIQFIGKRRLCTGHRAHRPAWCRSTRQPPDRSEHRRVYLYGATRHRFGCRREGGPSPWPQRYRQGRSSGRDRHFSWCSLHDLRQPGATLISPMDRANVHTGRVRHSQHRSLAGCWRRLSIVRRHPNRRHRGSARRG